MLCPFVLFSLSFSVSIFRYTLEWRRKVPKSEVGGGGGSVCVCVKEPI